METSLEKKLSEGTLSRRDFFRLLFTGAVYLALPSLGSGCREKEGYIYYGKAPQTQQASKGANFTCWGKDDYLTAQAASSLRELSNLGFGSISILTTWYQATTQLPAITPDNVLTPSDAGIENVIGKAASLGIKTMLKPHIDVYDGSWRGDISFSNEQDWADWFNSYTNFILHYAELAEKNGVDMLVIGTELKATIHRPEWNQVISAIRLAYHGKIVYAANWDNYKNVQFWHLLDYIGIDAYFPLTTSYSATSNELVAAWEQIAQEMETYSTQQGKKIILAELGYQDYDGTNTRPYNAPTRIVDQQEQADCLSAAFRALSKKDWLETICLWNFHYDLYDVDGFGVRSKLAEGVVRDWRPK